MENPKSLMLPAFCLPGLFVVIALSAAPARAHSQSPVAATMSSDSRSCSANPVLAPSKKSKNFKKSKHATLPDPLPACIELKGQPIEIQEFLQSVARELQWRIGETRASEDTWTFVRYLNDDELAKYSDTQVLVEPVVFTSGKAAIMVRTAELTDGYARVQISTHIRGEGKSTDQVSPQPGTSWPLGSKGVLEQELISALQTRYKRTE